MSTAPTANHSPSSQEDGSCIQSHAQAELQRAPLFRVSNSQFGVAALDGHGLAETRVLRYMRCAIVGFVGKLKSHPPRSRGTRDWHAPNRASSTKVELMNARLRTTRSRLGPHKASEDQQSALELALSRWSRRWVSRKQGGSADRGHTRGGRLSVQPSCFTLLLPLRLLQDMQAVTQFSQDQAPPLEVGITWSTVVLAFAPQYLCTSP